MKCFITKQDNCEWYPVRKNPHHCYFYLGYMFERENKHLLINIIISRWLSDITHMVGIRCGEIIFGLGYTYDVFYYKNGITNRERERHWERKEAISKQIPNHESWIMNHL